MPVRTGLLCGENEMLVDKLIDLSDTLSYLTGITGRCQLLDLLVRMWGKLHNSPRHRSS